MIEGGPFSYPAGMYLLFLDESGIPGADGIFALGGAAIRADQWAEVKERFAACLDGAG